MQTSDDNQTRRTLIERIKNREDQNAWSEFAEKYQNLIFGVALKCGLREAEAQDVVQETLLSVAKNIDKFDADPAFGSFRAWLLSLTRWRIIDQFRKREQGSEAGAASPRSGEETQRQTATQDRLADPNGNEFEKIWDEEERNTLVERAVDKLRRQVKPEHFQVFHLYAVKGLSAAEVSAQLGTSRLNVYKIYSRLYPRFRQAQHELRDEFREARQLK